MHDLRIAPARSDEDLADVVAIRTALARPWESGPAVEFLRHHLTIASELALFVARLGGEPVGCASAGDWVPGAGSATADGDVSVLPAHRRRGIGGALALAVSDHARSLGRSGIVTEVHEDDPESLAWAARRGFVEVERQQAVVLELADVEAVASDPPPGVEIVTRADPRELLDGMYAVGLEAALDIPGRDGERRPTFEQWRAFEIDRPSRPPELSFVALVADEVAGFASLDVSGAVAYNGLTAVGRAHRRRGIAHALKTAQIAAARARGIERLVTESEERNEPMRRLNESLGYRPVPGAVVLEGPLLGG